MKKFHGRTVALLIVAAMAVSSMLTVAYLGLTESLHASSDQVTGEYRADRETDVHSATDDGISEGSGFSKAERSKLDLVLQIIESSFYKDIDRQTLIDGAIRGMVEALEDPYTTYMNADEAGKFTANVDSTFSGIGAEVTMLDGQLTIVSPIKDSPAERAGIQAKDVVVSVNSESVSGFTLDEAVAKLRGPKGSQVKLEIMRAGTDGTIEIIVVRDEIDVETVFSRMEADGIGVIELRQFVQHSDVRFQEELDRLQEQGLKALVIDVRSNPGGYLYSVIDLLDILLPKGDIIVQIENRDGEIQITRAGGAGLNIPIAVLINEGSASASEILAAALQDNGKAKLFGVKSHGKGTVQSSYVKGFQDGSNMKITIARWLTPNGLFIDRTGIAPDVEVKLPDYFSAAPLPKDEILEAGHNHAAVANLQLMLRALGYETDRADGYFSESTVEAVKQFQHISGLPATGQVDGTTAERLESAVVELIGDPQRDTQLQAALEHLRQALGIAE